MRTLNKAFGLSCILSLSLVAGCGHYVVPGKSQPAEVTQQQSAEGTQMQVQDDGTVTFVQNRLEVSVRPMTDEELNRQYPSQSTGFDMMGYALFRPFPFPFLFALSFPFLRPFFLVLPSPVAFSKFPFTPRRREKIRKVGGLLHRTQRGREEREER